MSDRELLELAAKAAGVKIDCSTKNGGGRFNDGFDIMGNPVLDWHNGVKWNPLTEDGDALRLAVSLKLCVSIFNDHTDTTVSFNEIVEMHNNDAMSATRRAIVRAAAEIGMGMK